jgi:zinc protease
LQQDKELPLLSMTVMLRGGSRDEPEGKTGLADIFAESWRSGRHADADRRPDRRFFGAAGSQHRDR